MFAPAHDEGNPISCVEGLALAVSEWATFDVRLKLMLS